MGVPEEIPHVIQSHDDHDEAAAAAMHQVEDAVLTAIGVGPVYTAGR